MKAFMEEETVQRVGGRKICGVARFLAVTCMGVALGLHAAESSEPVVELTLEDYLQRVLDQNDRIQISVLQTEVGLRRLDAERTLYNPELVLNGQYQDLDRPNTVQQERQLSGLAEFDQQSHLYSSGIESLIPGGGRVRLGYSVSRLKNNLQGSSSIFGTTRPPGAEFVTFTGLSLVQPLLKNAWGAEMTPLRIAAQDSHIAFQGYRRELMRVITQAETLYWDLYYAQQRVQFLSESVSVTQNLLDDTKVKQNVGSASPLDVLEVESALAQRQAQLLDAEQAVIENMNRLLSLSANDQENSDQRVVSVDSPTLSDIENYSFVAARYEADKWNPDLLAQQREIIKQRVRLKYAKNQRLPDLNLTGDYGYNGLGDSAGNSFDDVSNSDFVTWSVGVELRVPLDGGGRVKNELKAVKLEVQQAELGLKSMETELSNGIKAALHNLKSTHSSVGNHDKVVGFYDNLLKTQLERLEVGTVDNQQVLETEEDLLEAKIQSLMAKVLFRRAVLQLQILSGTVLKERNVELSRELLAEQTRSLVEASGIDAATFQKYRMNLSRYYRLGATTKEP
ncbi:MAG: TolC family protein [Verrucomicrobia bacterium]|jgi:outer membrane protein TolC|nr:TolC family protein [Verrucomicrobiota bacterium]